MMQQDESTVPAERSSVDGLPPYQDDTPEYAPSLQFYGLALMKVEFDTPWSDRNTPFKPVVVELNSNQLNLYEFAADKATSNAIKSLYRHQNYDDTPSKESPTAERIEDYFFDCDAYGDGLVPISCRPMLSKLRSCMDKRKTQKTLSTWLSQSFCHNKLLLEPTSNRAVYEEFAAAYRGTLLHSYTLLNLKVGEAPSMMLARYKEDKKRLRNDLTLVNYRNTLRLRVEYTQLLLHFWSFHGMVHWFRNMSVGRDLASSIDDRKLSVLKSIPRNFSLLNNALLEASAREALALNPTTRKMAHRDSFSSGEDRESCFSECSMSSGETRASSISESCSEACKKLTVDIYGFKLACFENVYTPIEKQYISNCIPVLNSFDKWTGARLTISNYENLLLKNEQITCNENGRLFISHHTFSNAVKNFNKQQPRGASRRCRDFNIEAAGLVSLTRNF